MLQEVLNLAKSIDTTLKNLNERQIHAQGAATLDAANKETRRLENKRQALKDKLEDEVFPINRLTKANYTLFQSKGFQRAVAEIVAGQLSSHEKNALRAQFNTVLFETVFTRRCYSFFYVGSGG